MRLIAISRAGGASWSGAHEPVGSVEDVEGTHRLQRDALHQQHVILEPAITK